MVWRGKERRKAPDIWVYLARFLAVGGWICFIFALIVSFYAAPEKNYGLVRYHQLPIRTSWLMPLADYLYLVLWFSAFSSLVCFIIDRFRNRRKNDNSHFNLILLFLVSVSWITYILFYVK